VPIGPSLGPAEHLFVEAEGRLRRGGSRVASQRARSRAWRIGILLYAKQEQANISPMLRGLEALGYVDGKTMVIEYRDAAGKYERLPEAANELVRLTPDVIFSFGGEQAPIVKKATATFPIVVVVSNGREAITTLASLTYSPALAERGNFAPSKPTDWPTRPAVPIRAASA
jgi:hypothetical protein